MRFAVRSTHVRIACHRRCSRRACQCCGMTAGERSDVWPLQTPCYIPGNGAASLCNSNDNMKIVFICIAPYLRNKTKALGNTIDIRMESKS